MVQYDLPLFTLTPDDVEVGPYCISSSVLHSAIRLVSTNPPAIDADMFGAAAAWYTAVCTQLKVITL